MASVSVGVGEGLLQCCCRARGERSSRGGNRWSKRPDCICLQLKHRVIAIMIVGPTSLTACQKRKHQRIVILPVAQASWFCKERVPQGGHAGRASVRTEQEINWDNLKCYIQDMYEMFMRGKLLPHTPAVRCHSKGTCRSNQAPGMSTHHSACDLTWPADGLVRYFYTHNYTHTQTSPHANTSCHTTRFAHVWKWAHKHTHKHVHTVSTLVSECLRVFSCACRHSHTHQCIFTHAYNVSNIHHVEKRGLHLWVGPPRDHAACLNGVRAGYG